MSQSPKGLNKAQQEAVAYTDGPLLIVAGAGTGKTTVITQKIAHLVNTKGVEPGRILALTFTEKAASEMQERAEEMLESTFLDAHISTFHAFCQGLLESYGIHIGIPSRCKLFTETECWLMLHNNLYELELDYFRPLGNPTKHIHDFLNHFSKCKDELISPQSYLEYAESLTLDNDAELQEDKTRITELANLYHKYNQLLLDAGAMDFGDLIYYTVKLLKERPAVAKQIRQRFTHILVDEFQDVNYAQYELVKELAQHAQLTVVGDDDQSIYAFRGANVANILRFKDEYTDAKEIVLTENYRSGQQILDCAYQLIQNNNPERLESKLNINKKLIGTADDTASVSHLHFNSLHEEVSGVVEKIKEIKAMDSEASWDDFAILVRANSHADQFMDELERYGVPYEFLSASGLHRQAIVLDALHCLKILKNNLDSLALYRILKFECLEFPTEELHKMTQLLQKKPHSYYEALQDKSLLELSGETQAKADRLLQQIREHTKLAAFSKPSIVLLSFFEAIGYLSQLTHAVESGDQEAITQIFHLRQLFDYLETYEKAVPEARVENFLEYHNSLLEAGDEGALYQPSDTPESVNILTIHKSKGLEFKYVFMVNMVEDRFPARRKGGGLSVPDALLHEPNNEVDAHYQEERRLCYVGITRAKKGLWFSSSLDYGGARAKKPSRFLVEVGFTGQIPQKRSHAVLVREKVTKETTKKEDDFYTIPHSFSFSQIKTYETCPYKYKLAHVLELPSRGSGTSSFGQTLHNTLQEFYGRIQELNRTEQSTLFEPGALQDVPKNIVAPVFSELIEMYERNWIDDWYKGKRQHDEFYKKGKEILKIFYEVEDGNWTIPVELESRFKIKIGGNAITGRIDRVDKHADGTLEIIDYKTGKTKEKLEAGDKEQLLLYHIAAESSEPYRSHGSPGLLTFYYLNDNIKMSFSGNEKQIHRLKEKLEATIEKIKEKQFKPTPNKFVCGFCDFKEICEYRKL